MDNNTKIKHLNSLSDILTDRAVDIAGHTAYVARLLEKSDDLTDRIANRRLADLSLLLRDMSLRCVRLADEVDTLKGH